MALDFTGIKGIRSVGGGTLYVYWDHAEPQVEVESYNIYIRKDNAYVFGDNYIWANVNSYVKSAILRTEGDSTTYLRDLNSPNIYYVGVRAEQFDGLSDGNIQVVNDIVVGDGSKSVEAPDRKIAKVG